MKTAREKQRAAAGVPSNAQLVQRHLVGSRVRQGTANVGGRPRGEIRVALTSALAELTAEQGGAVWLELMQRARVGRAATRDALKSMVRSGQIRISGQRADPVSGRMLNVYAPAAVEQTADAASALSGALNAWWAR